MHVLLVDEDLD